MTNNILCSPYPIWDEQNLADYENYDQYGSLMESLIEYEQIADYADEFTLDYFEQELIYLKRPFIKQGQVFFNIFRTFVYREKGYDSFPKYCQEVHGLKFWQVKKIIDTSRIATFLMSKEFKVIPKNKYQCEILMWLENTTILNEYYPEGYDRI